MAYFKVRYLGHERFWDMNIGLSCNPGTEVVVNGDQYQAIKGAYPHLFVRTDKPPAEAKQQSAPQKAIPKKK